MTFRCHFDAILKGIDAAEEHLQNPAPVAKKWAKGYREEVKTLLAGGGIGSIPYAQSTMQRLEGTGTGQVSRLGTVRMERLKRTEKQIKSHKKKLAREGWSSEWQAKQDALNKRVQNYAKAEDRAARAEARRQKLKAQVAKLQKAAARGSGESAKKWEAAKNKLEKANQRNTGKRKSEIRQHPLQFMGKTIGSKVYPDYRVKVFSAAMEIGKAHDEGAGSSDKKRGQTPRRAFIKTPDFDAQVERLAVMFKEDIEDAFHGG